MEQERAAVFLADYEYQGTQINKIYTILEKKASLVSTGNISSEMVESTGYWLHNLYCAFEDLFKIVVNFWENTIISNGALYRELLKRMVFEIREIRPALISEKSLQGLDELRGFRHVFRHAYTYGLDDERVVFLLKRILKQKQSILAELDCFRQKVETLIKED